MSKHPSDPTTLRLGLRAPRRARDIDMRLGPEEAAAVAGRLGIIGLRKARLHGTLRPVGRDDWDLDVDLGATVTQACVVTLDPVTTRIEEPVIRRYRLAAEGPPAEGEIEMPEDDTVEPVPETLELAAVFEEALALALPPYPRTETAPVDEAPFGPPGVAPLRDADMKPLAGLANLKRKLGGGDA